MVFNAIILVSHMQLVSLLHDLIYTYDQSIQTDMILFILDCMAEAFHAVPHRHFLYKLDWYGIWEADLQFTE